MVAVGRVREGLARAFGLCYSLLFLCLWGSLVFFNNATLPVSGPGQLGFGLLVLTALAAAGLVARRLFSAAKAWVLLVVGTVLLLGAQAVLLPAICTDIGWDPAALMGAAQSEDAAAYSWYFSAYPNNLLLLLVYRAALLVFTLAGVSNIWLGLGFVNALAVDAAILLCSVVALWWFGRRAMGYTFLLCALLLGLSPWLMVPYSDTLAAPFVAGIVFLWALAGRVGARRRWACGLGAGVLAAVGYLVKPTVLIAVVAIGIATALAGPLKSSLLPAAAGLVAGAVVLAGFALYTPRQNIVDIQPGRSMPAASYLMMGLSQRDLANGRTLYGAFSEQDVAAVQAQGDTAAMRGYALEQTAARWQERGFFGTLAFYWNKARWITSEGGFFFGGEGSFANYGPADNPARRLVYPAGACNGAYTAFAGGVWAVALLCAALPGGGRDRRLLALRLAFFGLVLFTTLFEGRSRYLLCYLPLVALLAGWRLAAIGRSIPEKFRRIQP